MYKGLLFVAAALAMLWWAGSVGHADELGNGPMYDPPASPIDASVQIYAEDGGMGTGTILSVGGLVLTAAHVVGSGSIMVVMHDGTTYPAIVIAENALLDIAVLHVQGPTPEGLAVSCLPMIEGQGFYWIGNPIGLNWNMGQGVVAGLSGRTMRPWNVSVRAPFNHGDSGSGILDEDNVIRGVVVSSAPYPEGGMSQNGFIVPATSFCGMLFELIRGS